MTKEPADFRKALAAAPAAKAKWDDLTPIGRRDFIMWIESAKQTQTRKARIERACDMLVTGKRRPCCFSIVPLDLHLALKAMPAAKTGWSRLTPHAKRDLIGRIESAAQKNTRKRRIDEACAMLAAESGAKEERHLTVISVRCKPGSSQPGIALEEGGVVLRVRERAVEGAANDACIRALASALGVPKTAVRLIAGARNKSKRFEVAGLDAEQSRARLRSRIDDKGF